MTTPTTPGTPLGLPNENDLLRITTLIPTFIVGQPDAHGYAGLWLDFTCDEDSEPVWFTEYGQWPQRLRAATQTGGALLVNLGPKTWGICLQVEPCREFPTPDPIVIASTNDYAEGEALCKALQGFMSAFFEWQDATSEDAEAASSEPIVE